MEPPQQPGPPRHLGPAPGRGFDPQSYSAVSFLQTVLWRWGGTYSIGHGMGEIMLANRRPWGWGVGRRNGRKLGIKMVLIELRETEAQSMYTGGNPGPTPLPGNPGVRPRSRGRGL